MRVFDSTSYSSGASQSQKKRLLAKAQSECMITKQEPGLSYESASVIAQREYAAHLHPCHVSSSQPGTACSSGSSTSGSSHDYIVYR